MNPTQYDRYMQSKLNRLKKDQDVWLARRDTRFHLIPISWVEELQSGMFLYKRSHRGAISIAKFEQIEGTVKFLRIDSNDTRKYTLHPRDIYGIVDFWTKTGENPSKFKINAELLEWQDLIEQLQQVLNRSVTNVELST